jgi:hypothetical protein
MYGTTQGNSNHSNGWIEIQSEMNRAGAAKPKMLAVARLAPVSIEVSWYIAGGRFRHEQLTFAKRSEWHTASRVRTLMKHGLVL